MNKKKTIIYTFSTLLLTMSLGSLAFASGNFKYITGETYLKIEQKLSTFTKARLEEISSVIDSIIPNTNSTTDKGIYGEFKTMVDEKISQTGSSNGMPGVPPGGFGEGTPPGGSGTAMTPPGAGTSNSNVEINASTSGISLSTGTKTITTGNFTSTQADESAVVVTNSGVLNLSNVTIDKSGDVSNTENSEFYGLNSGVIANDGGTLNITDSTVKTTSNGANGVFSTKNSTVNLSNVTVVTTAESGARGLDATYGGTINADRVNISTVGIHSAASATDRGEGNVTITNSVLQTIGQDSPAIYSTGKFILKNTTGIATGAEAAVIEGQNSISLTDCILKGMKNWGVMIYQSFSGDADGHGGVFSMTGGSLTATNGPLFYSANTTGYINLSDVDLQADSGILVQATSNSRWGQTGSNGANLIINTTTQTLTGDITADGISTVQMALKNNSILNGAINTDKTAKSVNINLDSTSTWNLTKDSYINVVSANISGTTITNIKGNGFTVYYKIDENTSLGGKTYSLSNGGYLKPY